MSTLAHLARRLVPLAAVATLVAAMGGTWSTGTAALAAPPVGAAARAPVLPGGGAPPTSAPPGRADAASPPARHPGHKELAGKLNLNTATEDQLLLLPTVGPSKAERVVAWRKKNGAFKRIADLRRVKGFGYKTLKRLEPFLDIKGESTLAER